MMDLLTFLKTHPNYISKTDPTDAVLFTWCQDPDTSQKMPMLDLISQFDDWGELSGIQDSAASGLAKKQAGLVLDATELACLDALSLMETSRTYGRDTVNWAKARHLERLNNLLAVGKTTTAHRDALLAMAPTVITLRWQAQPLMLNGVVLGSLDLGHIAEARK